MKADYIFKTKIVAGLGYIFNAIHMKCQTIFQKTKKDLSCAVVTNGGKRPDNMSQHMRFFGTYRIVKQ